MLRQLLAWLVRISMRSNRIDARVPDHAQPPSYDRLFSRSIDGREDLETIRARHPPKLQLNAPRPTNSPTEAAYLAGATAFPGFVIAVRDETHPCMIIARAAQAISIAASTSQSHAALLAALNTMETLAILSYEDACDSTVFGDENGAQPLLNAIDTPVRQALAQKPPSNSFIPHYESLLPAGLASSGTILGDRAIMEILSSNMHILRPSM